MDLINKYRIQKPLALFLYSAFLLYGRFCSFQLARLTGVEPYHWGAGNYLGSSAALLMLSYSYLIYFILWTDRKRVDDKPFFRASYWVCGVGLGVNAAALLIWVFFQHQWLFSIAYLINEVIALVLNLILFLFAKCCYEDNPEDRLFEERMKARRKKKQK